ncbi:MAG: hypothetical protein CMP14_05845 [Rickettsiales bacterium]|nr:hypothetical protein [Rickettsiales bacterium]|tara:strand:- start:4380 stop:4688 length:309 start_codon:yes stop_codon:yes gene_type:complete
MTESERIEQLTNEKWDAIGKATKLGTSISHRLFDDVLLTLSSVEGKLKFALSPNFDDEKRISCEFTENSVKETQELVHKTRKELTKIISDLRDGVLNKLLEK